MSEPELITDAQVVVGTFKIQEHQGSETKSYEVYAYGAIARECFKALSSGQTVTVEGRLIKRLHEIEKDRAGVTNAIIANRVWLNHLRLLVA
ncbi:MAG: hypothetical protein WAN59_02995 [Candidatus Baltobacteraceae bacterium]